MSISDSIVVIKNILSVVDKVLHVVVGVVDYVLNVVKSGENG